MDGSTISSDSFMYNDELNIFEMRGVLLESGDIAGTFEAGGGSGTFTATRISQ